MRPTSFIALGLLCCGSAAIAQLRPPVERQVNITASTDLAYDSNVFNSNAETEALFGGRRGSDIRATPALNFDIVLPVSRQSVYAHGMVGYDFYRRNPRLDSERISIDGGANLSMAGCAPNLNARYARRQSDFADIFIAGQRRNRQTETSLGAGAVCGGPLGLQSGANYSHTEVSNSNNILALQDYRSDTIGANIGYTRPTLGVLSLYGQYTTTTYNNRLFLIPGIGTVSDGVEVYAAGVRFERNIGSRISGSVHAGYTWVRPKLPISPRFNGASYGADINLRPMEEMSLTLTAGRDVSASGLLDVSYTITDRYSLDGSYALGRTLSLIYGASWQNRKVRGPTTVTLIRLVDDQVTQGHIGLNYRVNEHLSLHTQFIQERRDSDSIFQRYNSSSVLFGAAFSI